MKTIFKLNGTEKIPVKLNSPFNNQYPFNGTVTPPPQVVDFSSSAVGNGYQFQSTANGTRYEFSQINDIDIGYTNPVTINLPTEMLDGTDTGTTDYSVIPVCNDDNFGPNIFVGSKTSTSNQFQARRLNNDATVDEPLDIRYSWIGGGVKSAALGSDVFVDTGKNANGDYIRYYDAGGNDLVVIMQGQVTSFASGTVNFPYTLEDNFYYPVGGIVNNSLSVGPPRFSGTFNTTDMPMACILNNSGSTVSSTAYWQVVWIKNTNTTYDQLEIGASGNSRFAIFTDSGATVRRVLQTGVSGTASSPTITLPQALTSFPNNTDYRVSLGGTVNNRINGSLLEMTTVRTATAFRIQHKDRNTILSSASYWIADWISGAI